MNKTSNDSPIGTNWKEFEKEIFTSEEIAESDLRVALIGEIIRIRKENGISQKRLGEISGIRQPIIARMEKGYTNPRLDTVLKILASLGKTLVIAPLQTKE